MAKTSKIIKILQDQGNKAANDVAQMVMRRKTLLSQALNGVSSDNKRLKNAAAKTIKNVSELKPEIIYPHFDFFADLLARDDTILIRKGYFGFFAVCGTR
jgi:hypothetical protein